MYRQLFTRREEGQALLLVALAFILLVAFLGLALDGANAFGQRRLVGNAADAAAIAGTRELIVQLGRGDGGTHVNDIIESFLTSRNDLRGAEVAWSAFYIERLAIDGSLGPVVDGARPPSTADGVRVEVVITFPTYFMGVFGQRTLNVSGKGSAIFGPLGTALGQDLVPLALSLTGWTILEREGTVRLDMRDRILPSLVYNDPLNPDAGFSLVLPDDVVSAANIKHVSFAEVAGAPATGADCGSTTPVDSLSYWWCQGSPNKLRIGRELPTTGPDFNDLNGAINWRRSNRNVLVLPLYTDSWGASGLYQELVNFVAVEITGFNQSEGILTVRHLEDYATAGALIGAGSGVETKVWAVNLTR